MGEWGSLQTGHHERDESITNQGKAHRTKLWSRNTQSVPIVHGIGTPCHMTVSTQCWGGYNKTKVHTCLCHMLFYVVKLKIKYFHPIQPIQLQTSRCHHWNI